MLVDIKIEVIKFSQKILRIDWLIILLSFFLIFMGCIALYSAAGGDWYPWAFLHFQRGMLGIFIAIFIAFIDIKVIYKFAWLPLIIIIFLLLFLHFSGVNSVNRWIDLGVISLQPSELAKVAIVLALARFFHDVPLRDQGKILYFIVSIIFIAPVIFLTMIQPDLGTSIMQTLILASIIFLAGIRVWVIILSSTIFISSLPIIWFQLHDYQKLRILTLLDPSRDILGSGYHITQSKIALGSGGVFGKGFLMGTQSHLNFLPEKHTDFVFTMLGEEFGLLGGIIIIFLFFILITYAFFISIFQTSQFGRLLCSGLAFLIFTYVFVNIGMVSGIIPVVGAPLPLISYGGTSMLTIFICIGLVMSASINRNISLN